MGLRISQLIADSDDLTLYGAWEFSGHPLVGSEVAGTTVVDDARVAMDGADVFVDFTRPGPTLEHIDAARQLGVAAVIGTTGFDGKFDEVFGDAARDIAIVAAPNMSVGVNLLFRLVNQAARVLADGYDPEIVELHHRWKEDSPSGTAVGLLEQIQDARGGKPVHGRQGFVGARTDSEIGVHAVRGGDIVGDHTVYFSGLGERIELTHRAQSRDTFAHGALRAARWLHGRQPGLYDMSHVLGWSQP